MNCRTCGKPISPLLFEILEGFCEMCYEYILPAMNEMRTKNIMSLTEMQPALYRLNDGKVFCACYLSQMIVYDPETNNFRVDFGDAGLKRMGKLVGMAGFYYDAEYYWATTPERVTESWNWFNAKTEANDEYWLAIEAETLWDFLQHNWSPFATDFRESLIVDIISLMLDLHALDQSKIDVSAKLLEIKNEKIKGNIEAYRRLSNNMKFHTSVKMAKLAFLHLRKIRRELANLSSEARLARFAKDNGFHVALSKSPDLFINNKRIEVKRPKVQYANPRKQGEMHDGIIALREDSCIIEDLSKHIERGFKQKADVVAIEVNHLDKRPIKGFTSKWLNLNVDLAKALRDAISYEKKGIVILFKCRRGAYQGAVLRCKKI